MKMKNRMITTNEKCPVNHTGHSEQKIVRDVEITTNPH